VDIEHLVEMANQIGNFHEAFPDRNEGLSGAAGHIRKFWDPRMRRQLLEHVDRGAAGLEPFILEAIRLKRADLTPRTPATRS
jgi:formate dehydrogenase subunit delta